MLGTRFIDGLALLLDLPQDDVLRAISMITDIG